MTAKHRRDKRICGALKVELWANEKVVMATTKNLGHGGLFALCPERWPVGSQVRVKIIHPYGGLDIDARVVHHQGDGVGLEFIEPGADFNAGITFIIRELLAQGANPSDRRKADRDELDSAVVWVFQGTQTESTVRNISHAGIFIETYHAPAVGEQIVIYLPGHENAGTHVLGCSAKVVHHEGDGFGAQFIEPTEEFVQALDTLVPSKPD